ncbi:probable serine/threonine-protein kinase At1g54610 [Neltuma alba]|uniref:probable serine/threonine-protein kinase At1g54610 n=1 Tax=Neltuma alba TaxID=207710 RepID=UPI0010A4157E|nr:probable serine/threonine-protein kinase At1g54610 [Prosopis alba]XP_028768000.1 probable serine/threonine-protein kinase At1g54610 [Prosopis alba]XP_028772459.1 probable serine/threonine-protein kinase At1g54610 [Prosopis alba]
MGCVQAKPSGGSEAKGLERLKLENGYVGNGDFAAHRRSMGQIYGECEDIGRVHQREIRKHRLGSGIGNEEREGSSNRWMGEGKRNAVHDGEKIPRKSFDDEMVDGWPRWLVDNVPREVLAGLVPRSAESYVMLDKVGQGTYSNVYKARDRATRELVALKKVRFDKSQPESIKFMAREIAILQILDHPNVIKLKGLATSRMQYSIYLVFDFMQSDLARIISRPEERLTEPQVKCYMHQLLSGLQHCHDRGILHRDIKGSNLLIDKNGMLKIADFGLANFYNLNHNQYLTNRVVTLWYRAPELLLGATNYGVGIDLWSAGCLLAEMFMGIPIMPGRTEVEQLHRIFRLCGTPSEEYWKKLNLPTTFRPPKTYRPSLAESFRDLPPSSVGLVCTLLTLDPAYRGTASKALQNQFFFTSPLARDLSGLPVSYTEHDGQNLTNEEIENVNAKLRRSHTRHERRRKNVASGWPTEHTVSSKEELSKEVEAFVPNEEQGRIPPSSRTSSVSDTAESKDHPSPLILSPNLAFGDQKLSHRIHRHVNVKNLPPLPKSKQHASNKQDNNYGPHRILRSASSREFRNPKKGVFGIH